MQKQETGFTQPYFNVPTSCWFPHQVLLQFGDHLLQDAVVVLLEAHQLGETRDEEA